MDTDRIARSTPTSSSRLGRRAILIGLGSLAVAGITAGCSTGGGPAPTKVASTPVGTPGEQTAPTAPSTARLPASSTASGPAPTATVTLPPTLTPAPTVPVPATSTPVALPAFSPRAITADMTDPNQWNTIVLESSARTLANNAYTVRVTKWPDGRGLFSWGDWVPKNVMLAPQFAAEVETQVTGDALAASGILFLFNYLSATEKQQYLAFMVRADGRFRVVQQLPGGEGFGVARIDWTPTSAINQSANATNIVRVIARNGTLICGVNGQQVAQLPIPAELATYRGFALAADVPMASTGREATTIFRNLRYETFSPQAQAQTQTLPLTQPRAPTCAPGTC